ncbi:putative serine dehydratase domain-containing protein [Phaeosphaeriaceae sp. PMI808]|nr:putative serine dehydratase domain-containing protein [Phaeosphaeriaceae sp. PMI808]
MASLTPIADYPVPSKASLTARYVGQKLSALPTPNVILDRAKIMKNCTTILQVCEDLGIGFRAHIKSHKTLELSQLQVGTKGLANFIVSTVIEAENLLPLVRDYQGNKRQSSILYGVPVSQSVVPRLVRLAENLEPGSVNLLIDNIDAFKKLEDALMISNVRFNVLIKIDTGYGRAGIKTDSPGFAELVHAVAKFKNRTVLRGFYSHYGHSYAGSSEDDAANGLIEELTSLERACSIVPKSFDEKLVLSVGATPTATAAQNMLSSSSPRTEEFHEILERLKSKYYVELHAGVYPLLDCQQIATHARPSNAAATESFQPLSKDSIAIRMLVEVTSTYLERAKPEALVSAGSLAMGREPCKSYPGWGIVTPDLGNSGAVSVYDESSDKTGWVVGRISQEHGILTWEGDKPKCNPLTIGDKLMVWPNHACVAGAGFGWYLVVDGDEGGDEVVDVWVRWRGW